MLRIISLSYLLISVLSFNIFSPKPKTSSGRELLVIGKGPPVLFSPGLFGTMPKWFYEEFLNNLKKNVSIVTINDFYPLKIEDICEIADSIAVDKLSLITHSSFDPNILTCDRLNSAVLCDPISIPNVDFTGIKTKSVTTDIPILGIKAEKAYYSKKSIPEFQCTEIIGNYIEEVYPGVGHPDILDDFWAEIALKTGIWEGISPDIVNFTDWKLLPNNKPDRKKYREYTSKRILEFLFNNTNL